jgi:hypothetical protein
MWGDIWRALKQFVHPCGQGGGLDDVLFTYVTAGQDENKREVYKWKLNTQIFRFFGDAEYGTSSRVTFSKNEKTFLLLVTYSWRFNCCL